MALESTWIVDFCSKFSGFVDFENTLDHGLAVNCGADSGLCQLKIGSWVPRNKILIVNLFSALVGMLMRSSKLPSFSSKRRRP